MSKSKFITTTIPYVNSKPHVGFALELVQADSFARYQRLKGEKIVFQSGTDENSLKNVLAARKRGVTIQAHVDEHAEVFRNLSEVLSISLDRFVRTTSAKHREAVQSFWNGLNAGDLYRKKYGGHYCVGCEDFLRESDLQHGLCPDHLKAPEYIEEENIFFRLSKFQSQIRSLIETDVIRITPSFRKREILSFIDGGLDDISISRSKARSCGWGIEVPDDAEQVVYVWIDALINYLSRDESIKSGDETWRVDFEKIHFIGKNVWKFHAIYWPALLLSAKRPLPNEIVIHGFLTLDGNKISKSLGNTIDPLSLVKQFSADTLRFYLLRLFSPFEDGDFSVSALQDAHNSYLVNGLGNLVSRLTTLAVRQKQAKANLTLSTAPISEFDTALSSYRYDEAVKALWRELDRINIEIANQRPWENLQGSENLILVARWLGELWRISFWLGALLPETAAKIQFRIENLDSVHPHLFERIC